MFRKGIVTFFDESLGKGFIELNTDHQQVAFKIEDFSNKSLLPQIGERVKCVVLEQHGELLAKFIVRLDHKNYIGDQKKSSAVIHTYEDDSYDQVRNARKMLKKRRMTSEQETLNEEKQQDEEKQGNIEQIEAIHENVNAVHSIEAIETIQNVDSQVESKHESIETIQDVALVNESKESVVENTQKTDTTEAIVSSETIHNIESQHTETKTESAEIVQNIELSNVHTEAVIENVQGIDSVDVIEPIQVIQNIDSQVESKSEAVEAVQDVELAKESVESTIENVQELATTEVAEPVEVIQNIESAQVNVNDEVIENIQNAESVQELTAKIDDHLESKDLIKDIESNEAVQNVDLQKVEPVGLEEDSTKIEHITEIDYDQVTESTKVIQNITQEQDQEAIQQLKPEAERDPQTVITDVVDGEQQVQTSSTSQIDQNLLEKNMNLNRFQRFIQAIKVKFLYSKRKQAPKVSGEKKGIRLNPWIVIIGVVLLLTVNGVMYAIDQYKQYKSDNELKLHQYEKEQKEVIKKQKQEAHAR